MNEADWRILGYVGLVLGVLFVVGGMVAFYFPQNWYLLGYYVYSTYPYRDYSGGLLVAGVVLGVVGGGALWRAGVEKEKSTQVTSPPPPQQYPPQVTQAVPPKYCRFCGAQNKSDATFCEKCGKQIS